MSGAVAAALRKLDAPEASLPALARYGELLLEANRSLNLTGAKTPEGIAELIADAFSLIGLVRGAFVDIGSGGGLPGIPLAILTGQRVSLIDATAKKVVFLTRALDVLELQGEAIAGRAETIARDPAYRGRFAHASARAVASAPAVLELSIPFLEIGGTALLPRGALIDLERHAAHDAALILGGEITEERRLSGDRCILIVTKVAETGQRFPRRNGIPQKRPLCFTPTVA